MMDEYLRFKTAVLFWLERLGLHDWEVQVVQLKFPRKDKNLYARVYMDYQQRQAVLRWNSCTMGDATFNTPEEVALHEVLHILLAAVTGLSAASGDVHAIPVDAEEHAVIKRLMKILKEDV